MSHSRTIMFLMLLAGCNNHSGPAPRGGLQFGDAGAPSDGGTTQADLDMIGPPDAGASPADLASTGALDAGALDGSTGTREDAASTSGTIEILAADWTRELDNAAEGAVCAWAPDDTLVLGATVGTDHGIVLGQGEPGQTSLDANQVEPALLDLSGTDGTILKSQWLAAFPPSAPPKSGVAEVRSLVVDGTGNVTASGYYLGQQTLMPGSGVVTSVAAPASDFDPFIVRSNLIGGTVPFATHGDPPAAGSVHYNPPVALTGTVNGGTFAVLSVSDASFVWGAGSADPETFGSSGALYFVWLDAGGVPTLSVRNVPKPANQAPLMSAHADARGNVYLAFDYTDAWTLFADSAAPFTLPSPAADLGGTTGGATVLMKITSDKRLAWVRTVTSTEKWGWSAGLALETDGTPVIAEEGSGTVTFAKSDGTALEVVSAPGGQGLVARFDADGGLTWATVLGDGVLVADGANLVGVTDPVIDAAGNIFVPAQIDTLPAVLPLDGKTLAIPASLGNAPQILEKLSPDGARLDARVFGAGIGPNHLSISPSGRFAMTTFLPGNAIYVGAKTGLEPGPSCDFCTVVFVFPAF